MMTVDKLVKVDIGLLGRLFLGMGLMFDQEYYGEGNKEIVGRSRGLNRPWTSARDKVIWTSDDWVT